MSEQPRGYRSDFPRQGDGGRARGEPRPPERLTGYDVVEIGPLLRKRLQWEADNPRPEQLVRAERAIVRGLQAEGFGLQSQMTRHDGFEIVVDGVLVRVELLEEA